MVQAGLWCGAVLWVTQNEPKKKKKIVRLTAHKGLKKVVGNLPR